MTLCQFSLFAERSTVMCSHCFCRFVCVLRLREVKWVELRYLLGATSGVWTAIYGISVLVLLCCCSRGVFFFRCLLTRLVCSLLLSNFFFVLVSFDCRILEFFFMNVDKYDGVYVCVCVRDVLLTWSRRGVCHQDLMVLNVNLNFGITVL